jgi:hypothetical protein
MPFAFLCRLDGHHKANTATSGDAVSSRDESPHARSRGQVAAVMIQANALNHNDFPGLASATMSSQTRAPD